MDQKIKVLVIGQTPPPFGGQALSIKDIVDARFENIVIFHVRMAFSENLGEMGGLRPGKILHLFSVLFKSLYILITNRIDICYYPPTAGEKAFPILRDIFLLFLYGLFSLA